MQSYFLQRLLLIIPTFIGITLLVFTLTRLVPGGPIERMLAEAQFSNSATSSSTNGFGSQSLSEDQLDQLKAYYGFDKPIVSSYFEWLWKILKLDLGESTRYGEPVWESIKDRLPISIFYGVTTMILTYLICIPLGIVKAIKHGTPFDHASSAFIFISYAVPGYVIGIACIAYFAVHLEWFPLGGFVSDEFEYLSTWEKVKDLLNHAALPLIAYMMGSLAVMTFMMKNALMENLAADYVRTATAKGFSFKQAVTRHALRNSLIPLATHFGQNIGVILGGSFLIEKIFNIDGIGLLGYEALVERDYPVVMGILVISAVLYLIGNILSDICVAWADPRIRFGENK
ncbi:ABC transporter permease subunit [Bermanella sp. WJH001]|uniref:ABC transporter permease subunit n=1 Tax=Bermanella sp. WJH001 TaxID=3048005 RepID=UPI0024BD65C5|nr:ABC transporter permease subunit [Bermanella sp. WJH001]MDJ1537092.1 ABC transporter permease subunit [Bermanella sp. WJH001]